MWDDTYLPLFKTVAGKFVQTIRFADQLSRKRFQITMTTGDIKKCEEETGHARVPGRNQCMCGYRSYPCEDCGEHTFHAETCPQRVGPK
jgi:hypothetical protein